MRILCFPRRYCGTANLNASHFSRCPTRLDKYQKCCSSQLTHCTSDWILTSLSQHSCTPSLIVSFLSYLATCVNIVNKFGYSSYTFIKTETERCWNSKICFTRRQSTKSKQEVPLNQFHKSYCFYKFLRSHSALAELSAQTNTMIIKYM